MAYVSLERRYWPNKPREADELVKNSFQGLFLFAIGLSFSPSAVFYETYKMNDLNDIYV